MAKNTTKPRTKNYRKIIKAAQEEFALKGLNGARMQAIADRAGLPKANIHYYFKDKVTLYTAALNSVMETWNVFFESTEEEVLEPKKTLDTPEPLFVPALSVTCSQFLNVKINFIIF